LMFVKVCFFLLFFFIDPAYSLILPPDPFESADHYALLNPASDGAITQILVKDPIPADANHRTLLIHYQKTPDSLPVLIAEYRPEQLHLGPAPDAYRPPPPPPDGTLIFGPVTVLRKREAPKTEQVSFSISDATGPFLLRVTKGRLCGAKRATYAWVKLNGSEVFRPSEFKQNVTELSRQVTLLSGENLLEVKLRGVPGSFITLELFRLDRRACPVLDAHTFKRSKGKLSQETLEFELGPQFFGPFTLHLTNGTTDGYQRVDSAKIKLNGRLVFEPHDFNKLAEEVSRIVSLRSKNKLSVELRGAPGDFLTLWIVGHDHTPPIVTIINPSFGDTFDTDLIAVRGTVDDPFSSVTVNGITAQVDYDGFFTVEGITLVEGENAIRVVATDTCGNQGEVEIVVYLTTVRRGPYLLFCPEPFLERPPDLPEEGCNQERFAKYIAAIGGLTDETAVSVTINGVLFPKGVEVLNPEKGLQGIREGNFFWVFVDILQVDGSHPFTAVATNAEGRQTEATVYFLRDTVPPKLTVASPTDGLVTSNPEITITGTVDDPEAMVRLGWYGAEIPVEGGSFTTTDTLPWEGSNYVIVTAIDPAGNSAYFSRMVILDTQPPQINVTYPAEGSAVNTPILNVTGNVIDENINEVTVSVNGSQPQTLTLTGTNFSGVSNLASGQNTLTFHAVDKAGNTSSVTRSVLLDVEVPAVTMTAPLSGVVISGMVNVTVEATDSASGIASVTLYVDGQAQTTLNQAPFSFSVDTSGLVPGPHTLTTRAADQAGNQGETSITIVVVEAIRIEITSPTNGSTTNKSTGIVQGKIYNETGEVGVVVNGILAEVQGGNFAVIVPLQIGQNIIIATATGPDGIQGQASITINTETQEEFISLTAIPTSGTLDQIGILNVTFEAQVSLVNPVSSYSWDFNGDGTPELVGAEASVTAQYQYPGLYFPKVSVTDTQGSVYTETTIVHVLSREEMNALLKSKWEAMEGALGQGNIDEALNYFITDSREEYREIFEVLAPQLPALVSAMREINMVEIKGNLAEYYIKRFQKGVDISYFIYFMRDENGVWRISSF